MIPFYKQNIGAVGENAAAKYLKKKKHKIIKRNFKNYYGEVDIITQDREYTVFVEVKTRTSAEYGEASRAVNLRKQQKIMLVAQTYLNNPEETNIRFDIVEVYLNKENLKLQKINHIENAFGF
ncbi:MAG: YraN family protein [Clostridia bacterium]|nr:YraN family protein [Clostridia bacterium]